MKSFIKFLSFILLPAVLIGVVAVSCNKTDPEPNNGDPIVYYVRATDPGISDSLLVGAFMGNLIAIIGDNLGDTKELWFNDQKATLTPTYITDQSILVSVPATVPSEVTDKIRFVFGDGSELLYDFKVNIAAPVVNSILCEYVADGEPAFIYGDFFFEPKVIFPGELEAELISVDKNIIECLVPAGTTTGPITVQTNFGKTKSGFVFRDDRGIFLDFDSKPGGGWRSGKLQSTDPEGVAGNYAALTGNLGGDWAWVDDFLEIDLWGQSAGRPQGPLFVGNPDDMVLKFEAYVKNEWTGGWMQFIFSPWSNAGNSVNTDRSLARGFWKPWEGSGTYQTDGWITVSLPLADFIYDHDATVNNLHLVYPDNCGSLTIFVWGPVPVPCDVAIMIDNVRVVPK